jgi:hypothetical protein
VEHRAKALWGAPRHPSELAGRCNDILAPQDDGSRRRSTRPRLNDAEHREDPLRKITVPEPDAHRRDRLASFRIATPAT